MLFLNRHITHVLRICKFPDFVKRSRPSNFPSHMKKRTRLCGKTGRLASLCVSHCLVAIPHTCAYVSLLTITCSDCFCVVNCKFSFVFRVCHRSTYLWLRLSLSSSLNFFYPIICILSFLDRSTALLQKLFFILSFNNHIFEIITHSQLLVR